MSALPIPAAIACHANHEYGHVLVARMHSSGEFPMELAWRTASIMARKLIKSSQNANCDHEDLRQELIAAAWARWDRYDPAAGAPSTFLGVVMRHAYVSVVRTFSALKRQPRTMGFPRKPVEYDAGDNYDCIDPAHQNTEMHLDVTARIAALPVYLHRTATLLMSMNVAEAARNLGVSRYHVMGQLAEIRQEFSRAGLNPRTDGRPI